ncbi:MAG: hypothetical protein JNN18_15225 [Rubrivivax sp.]|jgi:hypothetical protein|nr:hypothetical protein [Rubrivivax sp.]
MLREFLKVLLIPVLVGFGLIVALLAYMAYGERSAKDLAIKFCDSVKVGDDPIAVQSRATHSGAIPSSPTWVPWESQPRTLEVLFKGGIPLSAHGCRIQASERVTSAVYFHTR